MPNCFLNTAARHWYIQVSVAIGFFIAYARLQHNISFFSLQFHSSFFNLDWHPICWCSVFFAICFLEKTMRHTTSILLRMSALSSPFVIALIITFSHPVSLLILKLSFSPDFLQFARKVRHSSSVLQKRESVECWHY